LTAYEERVKEMDFKTIRISQLNLDRVRKEYAKPNKESMDLTILSKATKQLEFFNKFPKDAKNTLFLMAEHEIIPCGVTVFEQGDIGDMMYIILRGAIIAEKQTVETGPLPVPHISLFDG
jgi:hypothetical protein